MSRSLNNFVTKTTTAFTLLMGLNLGLVFLNIPPVIDDLMALYGVTYTKISLLISSLLWSHALMQIPGGMITDRLGVERALLISVIFMLGGNLISAVISTIEVAIVGRVIAGIGTGLSFVSTMKLVAIYAPRGRTGTFQAFFAGFFSIGSILAYIIIPRLISFGWQWIYLLPCFLCFPLGAWLIGIQSRSATAKPSNPLPIRRIVSMRIGWVIGLYHALSWGSMISLGNWVPSLLRETWSGNGTVQLAWGGALVMLISGLGRFSGGFIIMRFSPVKIANGTIATLAIISFGLFVLRQPPIVLSLALLGAWFSSVNFGAFFHLASKATSADSLATLFGFINFLANLGAILFTLMFGLVKDTTGSFSWGFGGLAFLSLLAFLLGLHNLKDMEKG